MRPRKYATELERAARKWHGPRLMTLYSIIAGLVWLFVFFVYVGSVKAIEYLGQSNIEQDIGDPINYFLFMYVIGAIVATVMTILFIFEFCIDDIEMYFKDRGLMRNALKVKNIREGRKKLYDKQTYNHGKSN